MGNESTKTYYDPNSKYFSCLERITVLELRGIARESGLSRYSALRKADLVGFLDRRSSEIKESLHKRIFPDALRAWVGLFVSDRHIAKHYTKLILDMLIRFGYSKPKHFDKGDIYCKCPDCFELSEDYNKLDEGDSDSESGNDYDSDSDTNDDWRERLEYIHALRRV